MNLIDLPFQSQNSDDVPKEWHHRACGIAAVKMLLDGYRTDDDGRPSTKNRKRDTLTMSDLINEGVALNGYTEHGWLHDVLIKILNNHGVHAERREFRSSNPIEQKALVDQGLRIIRQNLIEGRPVIASVSASFGQNIHSHLIVLCGWERDLIYFYDPDTRESDENFERTYTFNRMNPVSNQSSVPFDHFEKYWRGLVIFVA